MFVGYWDCACQTKKEANVCLAIMNRLISVIIFTFLTTAGVSVFAQSEVNAILVEKAERKLYLLADWKITHTFPISLGKNPTGHKQKEGDSRTPEGLYYINGRNPDSRFFRSLSISFPDKTDRRIARIRGNNPGGDIAIHGEPNDPIKKQNLKKDWTEGCIALKDEDMRVVWHLVKEGTPILIKP